MKLWVLAVGAASGFVLAAGAFGGIVDVVTNGSFESPVVVGVFQQFSSGIPGWTGSAGIELQANGPGHVSPFGNQYAELAVEGPSTYSQTVATVPGAQYDFSFYFSNRPATGTNSVTVAFTGSPSVTFTAADTGTVDFQQFTHTFVATSTQSVLSLIPTNLSNPGGGDLVDNVSLTIATSIDPRVGDPSAVPIPAAVWTGMSGLLALTTVGICRKVFRGRR